MSGTTGGGVTVPTVPVPVIFGGTGVTSSTGTGSVVLSTSPTLSAPTLVSDVVLKSSSNSRYKRLELNGYGNLTLYDDSTPTANADMVIDGDVTFRGKVFSYGTGYKQAITPQIPNYLTGNQYAVCRAVLAGGSFQTYASGVGVLIASGADTPIYLYPYMVKENVTIGSIGLRTATTGFTAGAVKLGLWYNDPAYNRPTGTPFAYNDAGFSVTNNNINYSGGLNYISNASPINAGTTIWLGLKATATTYGSFLASHNTNTEVVSLIGGAFSATSVPFGTGTSQIQGIQTASAVFSDAMSTTSISPTGTFYFVTGLGMPAMFFGV